MRSGKPSPTLAELRARAAAVEFQPVPPDLPAARTALGHYVAELDRRFPGGFDAAGQTVDDVDGLSPPAGVFLLAVSAGDPIACGGLRTLEPGLGEVKRMWVHPDWRGAGLGTRLLQALERQAVRLGHRRVRLDTNDTLDAAIGLYRRAGYRQIQRYNDNPYARLWFEKELRP
jgi:GNAT superfamily N-acetyltransferase